MNIHNYYYNEEGKNLLIEFSMDNDGDNIYRKDELSFRDIELYSPTIIEENDLNDIDETFIVELLTEFYKYNELPPKELF